MTTMLNNDYNASDDDEQAYNGTAHRPLVYIVHCHSFKQMYLFIHYFFLQFLP